LTDRSAEIARFIMSAEKDADQRHIVFNIWRLFHRVPPEQVMRGISIALEIYEAEEVPYVGK